ncbi:MAG: MoaD/ThiS family protein [Methanocellales archaeon]|nr:MoaD/ThiS family protein [Methanocellales archaeon]MDI6902676.1 MoaD/ThiS family protein [Methanocellales archaeon]
MIKIKVTTFSGDEKYIEVPEGSDYESLLIDLGINPETVIVYRDQQVVPLDECVEPGEIKILRVVSGG